MKANELSKYLAYADTDVDFTVIKTEEYERLRKIERLAKIIIRDKKLQILKEMFDK